VTADPDVAFSPTRTRTYSFPPGVPSRPAGRTFPPAHECERSDLQDIATESLYDEGYVLSGSRDHVRELCLDYLNLALEQVDDERRHAEAVRALQLQLAVHQGVAAALGSKLERNDKALYATTLELYQERELRTAALAEVERMRAIAIRLGGEVAELMRTGEAK
jgi:hypothetical protein